ncbi:MAG: putative glycoside hydrolase [Coriobacteriia bacterium]|nr:putative glycoside hydrolase [Coriobacteriia bacterium]
MRYLAKSSFRSAVVAALSVAVLAVSIGFSPISAATEAAVAAEVSATANAGYPRLVAWWPDVHSLAAEDIARFDAVILYDWAGPQAQAIKAADPATEIFLSTSASELTMYTELNPESWKNAKLAAASARWSVTQPGSTLTSAITAATTTIGVATADSTRFRVGDVLAIDEEFLEVQAVNAGTPGSLVVRRNAVVSGTRHAAASHAAGTRVAAVVREFPNTVLMDLTDSCPLVDVGNGPENFNMYLARVSAASISDPVWDGIYFDMIESNKSWVLDAAFARAFDLTRSNVIPANADAFNAAWAVGVRTFESRMRTLAGDRPVLTNGADANWDLVNGTCVERFPAKTTTTAEWRSRVFGSQVPYAGANYFAGLSGLGPNFSNLITYDQETDPAVALNSATWKPDYRKMRFGIATALLGDGLYSYDLGTWNRGDVPQLQWFDEYDNAGAGEGYLGSPLGDAQRVGMATASADLLNGDGAFSTSTQLAAWTLNSAESGYAGTKSLDSGAARVDVTGALGEAWKLTFLHPVQVTAGTPYTLTFRMKADRPADVQIFAQISSSPYTMPLNYEWVEADTEWRTYSLTTTSSSTLSPSLRFALGSATGTVWIDDVKLQTGTTSEVWRRDFEGGIALVNASDSPVTVDLGGTFSKIDGAQDRTVNDGSQVTSVTLPAKDGIVLLREAAPAPVVPEPEPAPVTPEPEPVVPAPAPEPSVPATVTPTIPTTPPATSVPVAKPTKVYRFLNRTNGTHFLTASAEERDTVIASWSNVYAYEGVAFSTVPASNSQPLYRFYNLASGSHFYTASADEANMIMAKWSNVYSFDGQAYNVSPQPVPGSAPVYRFYNLKNGSHFYTASEEEKSAVIAKWSGTYQYEGPAFWLGQ